MFACLNDETKSISSSFECVIFFRILVMSDTNDLNHSCIFHFMIIIIILINHLNGLSLHTQVNFDTFVF